MHRRAAEHIAAAMKTMTTTLSVDMKLSACAAPPEFLSSLIIALFKTSCGIAESAGLYVVKTAGAGQTSGNERVRAFIRGDTRANAVATRVNTRVNYYVGASIRNANICRSWEWQSWNSHEYRWNMSASGGAGR